MATEIENTTLLKTYEQRRKAITVLQRAFRGDRRGEHKLADAELGKDNPFLKDWEEGDLTTTKHLLDELLAADENDLKVMTELANKTQAGVGDKAARELMDAAEKEHGKKTDKDLESACLELQGKIDKLQAELTLLSAERSRRSRLKSIEEKLGVTTDTDRALLERLIKTDHISPKTKVPGSGAN